MHALHRLLPLVLASASFSCAAAPRAPAVPARDTLIRLPAPELSWSEGPQGRRIAVLYGSPSAEGPFVMRVVFPPRHLIERHWHPTAEFTTVLSGTVYLAFGEGADRSSARAYPPGSFLAVPAGMHIMGWTEDEEVVVQVHGNGPFEVVPVHAPGHASPR